MYNELKILYTALGPGDLVQYTKFLVHCTFSSCVICKQNTNLTVSNLKYLCKPYTKINCRLCYKKVDRSIPSLPTSAQYISF